ncbi:unnamed protein product, partial [marine sediment metagenome]
KKTATKANAYTGYQQNNDMSDCHSVQSSLSIVKVASYYKC